MKDVDNAEAPQGFKALSSNGMSCYGCSKCSFSSFDSIACGLGEIGMLGCCNGADRKDGQDVYFIPIDRRLENE